MECIVGITFIKFACIKEFRNNLYNMKKLFTKSNIKPPVYFFHIQVHHLSFERFHLAYQLQLMNVLGRKSSISLQPFLFLPYKITTTSSHSPIFNYLGISRLSDSARAPQTPFQNFLLESTPPPPRIQYTKRPLLRSFARIFSWKLQSFQKCRKGCRTKLGIVEIRQSEC